MIDQSKSYLCNFSLIAMLNFVWAKIPHPKTGKMKQVDTQLVTNTEQLNVSGEEKLALETSPMKLKKRNFAQHFLASIILMIIFAQTKNSPVKQLLRRGTENSSARKNSMKMKMGDHQENSKTGVRMKFFPRQWKVNDHKV